MKILIVEDDQDISDVIKVGLEAEGYIADTASDGLEGAQKAKMSPYDLIILDYSLPKMNGGEVCRELRNAGIVAPILFLTVLGDIEKKVGAFTDGADDYMTKPFHFEELRMRIKALLRRPTQIEPEILRAGDLALDTKKRIASHGSTVITLTRKEYNLLEYLMRNTRHPVTRSMIMEHVWSAESDPFSNTVEAHILNLRKKINISKGKDCIRNIPGRGYILES